MSLWACERCNGSMYLWNESTWDVCRCLSPAPCVTVGSMKPRVYSLPEFLRIWIHSTFSYKMSLNPDSGGKHRATHTKTFARYIWVAVVKLTLSFAGWERRLFLNSLVVKLSLKVRFMSTTDQKNPHSLTWSVVQVRDAESWRYRPFSWVYDGTLQCAKTIYEKSNGNVSGSRNNPDIGSLNIIPWSSRPNLSVLTIAFFIVTLSVRVSHFNILAQLVNCQSQSLWIMLSTRVVFQKQYESLWQTCS